MLRIAFLCSVLMLAGRISAQEVDHTAITVLSEGRAALNSDRAAAEDEAIWDAKRNAVEQAAGILVKSRTLGHSFQLESDEIRGQAAGFVKSWHLVPESRHVETLAGGQVLTVQIQATIALLPVIRHLSDIADVYADLERPRVRVDVSGDTLAQVVQNRLTAALTREGFEVAEQGPAEVTLTARLEVTRTLKLGDASAPYGVGEVAGACRARLMGRLVSAASEECLMVVDVEANGSSFHSDAEARSRSAENVILQTLGLQGTTFIQDLLVRWAAERQDGYVAALTVNGLNERQTDRLRGIIHDMRGYQRTLTETNNRSGWTVRFQTRLDLPSLRRRLREVNLPGVHLSVNTTRGPHIVCTAEH